jgi:uncharacterized protein YyaL (SSP411 family)
LLILKYKQIKYGIGVVLQYMENHKHTNQLIHASSPYLLQHAHNPVNWVEWSDAAFEKAKQEDKLVLISIGYSACHWCHVMERECFEQEDTAAIMNAHFVCIKVDREERPDVDQLYMDAVQLLTGQGGWPLNCFALPDGRPIHGGTYFPKKEWEHLLQSLANFYHQNKEEALRYANDLTQGIKQLNIVQQNINPYLLLDEWNDVVAQRKQDIDFELGGFSWAPKFPMPIHWELFMQQYFYTKDQFWLDAVTATLNKMAEGGIYDQVGGGFARYSVDVFWKVPHFEKMLYDNAQLVSVYLQAYQLTSNPLYKKVVKQTLAFIAREMTSEVGLFYSALDADSEGVEGKYYIWHKKELQTILGADEPLYSLYYSVDAYGNWEHERNILYKTRSNEELELLTGKSIAEVEQVIDLCNEKLLRYRERRVKPGLDDKSITAWNALMIKAYADAYLVLGDKEYLHAATRATDFILDKMWQNNQLYRIYKNGKVSIAAFADDYALFTEALIRLYEASNDENYLLHARELLAVCKANFYDETVGMFYFKSNTDEALVARKMEIQDDVIPSSNAVLAKCLLQLGYLFDEDQYHQMLTKQLQNVSPKIKNNSAGYSYWAQVLLAKYHGFAQVVITGNESDNPCAEFFKRYIPNKVVCVVQGASSISMLKEKTTLNNETTYYLCKDKTCGLPVTDVKKVIDDLVS